VPHEPPEVSVPLSLSALDSQKHLYCRTCQAVNPDVVSYGLVAIGFARAGILEDALRVLACAQQVGLRLTAASYAPLMSTSLERGQLNDVQAVWDHMMGHGLLPDVVCINLQLRSLLQQVWQSSHKYVLSSFDLPG
jgi:hypothetical protein